MHYTYTRTVLEKFEFIGPNQILEFISYVDVDPISKEKLKSVLVRTKLYWSCVRGPVLIVRTARNMHCYCGIESSHKNLFSLVQSPLFIIGAPKSKLNFTRAHFLLA